MIEILNYYTTHPLIKHNVVMHKSNKILSLLLSCLKLLYVSVHFVGFEDYVIVLKTNSYSLGNIYIMWCYRITKTNWLCITQCTKTFYCEILWLGRKITTLIFSDLLEIIFGHQKSIAYLNVLVGLTNSIFA